MMKRPVVNFLQVASLVMLLVALALLSAIATMHFAIHGAEVQVPALQGMTVADARSQTAGLGLNLDVDNRYYSSDVAAGHILTQSPPAGTVVRREWRVRVSESLGQQKVDVPDTVGKDERVAALTLRRVGLEVGATAHLPWAKQAEGTVIAQDPPAHAQGISQPSVNLLVAAPDDEAPDGFVMPELIGLPLATAQMQLVKVGIPAPEVTNVTVPLAPVGSADAPPKPPTRPGAVIAQTPAPGVRVFQNVAVKLTVAK
jgi:beta-lactam-binding protein with PASTA domain